MEELNLGDILAFFKKNFIIVVLATILFGVVGFLYTNYIQVPDYTSSTTLLLLQANTNEGTITQGDIQLNQKLVTTYSEIIKSNRVLDRIIKELNLNKTVNQLSKEITVSSKTDSIIITISVTDTNKVAAMNIANSTASVFMDEIIGLMSMQNVELVDEARLPVSSNIEYTKQVVIIAGVGFVISVMFLFLVFYFDTTVKSEEQIEKIIELPVLGSVPKNKKRRGLK